MSLRNPDGTLNPDYCPDYSATTLDWCKWSHEKFLRGVRGMTATQIGVYCLLLNEMYARGVPLGEASRQSMAQLARLCGIGPAPFSKIVDDLVASGRMVRLRGGLWDERVEITLADQSRVVAHNSQAGVSSGKKRSKINAAPERSLNAAETSDEPLKRIEEVRDTVSGSVPLPSTSEEEGARDARGLVVRVMEALGIDPAKPPRRWRSPTGPTHVCAWPLTLGLTDDEVVEACRASRIDNPEPPDSPAALDGYLRAVAKTKAAANGEKQAKIAAPPPAPKLSHEEAQAKALATWAERLRSKQYVPPSALKPAQARALLADPAFGVTPDMLRQAGISH